MDIETQTLNGKMIPYCISFFDGYDSFSYYKSDFKSVEDMLMSCIKSVIDHKYAGYKVYIHNLSKFDGIFLVRILALFKKGNKNITLNITKRDSAIISFKVLFKTYDEHGKQVTQSIEFRDSFLTLSSSLRKLAKSFKVDDKGIFPYDYVYNENIDLNYIGETPAHKYFDNVTDEEYNQYSSQFNNNWSLRHETIKYCEQDCFTLFQIMNKFNLLIFNRFNVTIQNYPTLPSLAFGIYRTNFMSPNIPKLVGDVYNFIRKGYTGGNSTRRGKGDFYFYFF